MEEKAYIRWLSNNRDRNQALLLKLYEILIANEIELSKAEDALNTFQALVAIAFSMWRAVFLGEVSDEFKPLYPSTKGFLVELIRHNSVSYFTDIRANHWSFMYYVNNARYRLRELIDDKLLPEGTDVFRGDMSPQDGWEYVHSLSTQATDEFVRQMKR